MATGALVAAALALAAWLYLALLHGGFWRADQWLPIDAPPPGGSGWPPVVAVVPARNEADVVATSLASLLAQDYPGSFEVVLVDDHSDDGTDAVARGVAAGNRQGRRLTVATAGPMPPGWVGKMWAVASGVEVARARNPEPVHLLLTDADVAHAPGTLRRLVAHAESMRLDLVSLMALLHTEGRAERLLIPAFVYFFQQLYPFRRVNRRGARTAGAAGGCMLVRATALARAGGIASIRGAIIDDCALARRLKDRGAIWLGLTRDVRSLRAYGGVAGVWKMVARTAYTQLRHSPLILAGTVLALVLLYVVPPLVAATAAVHGSIAAALVAAAAWVLMAWTFVPTLRLYGVSPALALALPLAGVLYCGMTVDSARRHRLGSGAQWKGRAGAGRRDA